MMSASLIVIALAAGLVLGMIPGLMAKRRGKCFLCAYLIGGAFFAALALFGARFILGF